MTDPPLPLLDDHAAALPLHAVRPAQLPPLLQRLRPAQAAYLQSQNFAAQAQELAMLPGDAGLAGAVLGLGADRSPYGFGDLAFRLPQGTGWRLEPGDFDRGAAALGFCLGAYAFRAFRKPKREPAQLVAGAEATRARRLAAATWRVRDLINMPANLLGPAELADATEQLARRFGARAARIVGGDVTRDYPAIAAVGAGSGRPPVVVVVHWRGSAASDASPLVSLCGKGVVFDTGGYDLKPSAAMLRMKKDMGGAATLLGLAQAVMDADLPVRLALRVGCVENSVSGTSMRPSDVIRTRRGLSVEIGNTDAEGRLVLADLLAEAAEERPDLLIDCATLTGAARVALGPDLPALFCNDDALSERVVGLGREQHDPIWPLPLWDEYAGWLDSQVADLNNVGSKPMAGSVTAALFLRRFVREELRWIHLDVYAWNDQARPGRPEGGEAQGLRSLFRLIETEFVVMKTDHARSVT